MRLIDEDELLKRINDMNIHCSPTILMDSVTYYDGEKVAEALEKATPKKPKYYRIGRWTYPECPNGCIEFGYNRPNYCSYCGQRIEWNKGGSE